MSADFIGVRTRTVGCYSPRRSICKCAGGSTQSAAFIASHHHSRWAPGMLIQAVNCRHERRSLIEAHIIAAQSRARFSKTYLLDLQLTSSDGKPVRSCHHSLRVVLRAC